jgi:hypothetical protein
MDYDHGEKVMKWEEILLPCPIAPIDKIWIFIETPKYLNPRERIASVLKEWGIPYVFFPIDNHLLSCRFRMIFEDRDDKVKIYFAMDPIECKAMDTIELGIRLLKEAGLISEENEKQVREELMKRWKEWVTKHAPRVSKLWEVLLTIDANND